MRGWTAEVGPDRARQCPPQQPLSSAASVVPPLNSGGPPGRPAQRWARAREGCGASSQQPLGSQEEHQRGSAQHTKVAQVGKTHVTAQQLREVRHFERPLRMALRGVSVPRSGNGALTCVGSAA
jgi:hypothetical protein